MVILKQVPVGIVGTGISVPEGILTNKDMEQRVETSDEWIRTRTGIRERRFVAKGEMTSDLAVEAAKNALQDAGITPEQIDMIIVATATPDFMFPSTACLVQDRIGAPRAAAFDLSAGCSGFVYALITGAQFIASGLYNTVLVIGAETLSKTIDWSDRNTCVLFGDAAGAAVLRPTEEGFGLLSSNMGSDGSGSDLLELERDDYIRMNGKEVFKFAVRAIEDTTLDILKKANLNPEDIKFLIPHQANHRIIEAAAKRLGLGMEKMYINVEKYGNTSAASIPVALHEARKEGLIRKGDNLILVGFGAGLTWAAAAIRWNMNC